VTSPGWRKAHRLGLDGVAKLPTLQQKAERTDVFEGSSKLLITNDKFELYKIRKVKNWK
jgi:hypothetical protein